MKIRTFLSRSARRALPALFLALFSAAAILYARGVYTFSFLRDSEGGTLPSPSSPLGRDDDASGTADTVKPDDTERVYVSAPGEMPRAMSEDDVLRLSGALRFSPEGVPALLAKGFSRSTEPYSAATSVVAYAGGFDFLPRLRSSYDTIEKTVSYVRPSEMSEPEPVWTEHIAEVPSVQLYMGYLLLDDGTNTRVYTADGLYLTAYRTLEYERAYTRDRAGNALFCRTDWRRTEEETADYYTVSENGMTPSDYDDLTDGRGVYFDYAPSYGLTDGNLTRFARRTTTVTEDEEGAETREESVTWAYGYTRSWLLYGGYKYAQAYDYREGVAAAVGADGRLVYIGPYGYPAFAAEKKYYYFEWEVQEYLLPPLTNGPESIGFFYYDHGLVRARRQLIDHWWYTYYGHVKRVALDEDVMLDKEGNIFPVPAGYDIVSYSDGVILLECDGKYGYMDFTGAWIAQPIYDYARPFSEGLAVAGFADGVRLMLDTEGNIVIPAGRYAYLSDVSSGVIAGYTKQGQWEILHKMARFES